MKVQAAAKRKSHERQNENVSSVQHVLTCALKELAVSISVLREAQWARGTTLQSHTTVTPLSRAAARQSHRQRAADSHSTRAAR